MRIVVTNPKWNSLTPYFKPGDRLAVMACSRSELRLQGLTGALGVGTSYAGHTYHEFRRDSSVLLAVGHVLTVVQVNENREIIFDVNSGGAAHEWNGL